jgi:hypothetical protein
VCLRSRSYKEDKEGEAAISKKRNYKDGEQKPVTPTDSLNHLHREEKIGTFSLITMAINRRDDEGVGYASNPVSHHFTGN